MTVNVSQTGRILIPEDAHFPDVCPKCGATIGANPRTDVEAHFARHHSISIGLAFRGADEQPVEFAYIGPVAGLSRRTWYVVVFDFPFEMVKIRPDEWRIAWMTGAGPGTEGVIG